MIRVDLTQGLKLKGYKKTIYVSSVVDDEVSLRVQDMKEENELYISALTLPKSMFNMPAQSISEKIRINQLEHLNGIKIHNVSASVVTILISANASETFIQLKLEMDFRMSHTQLKWHSKRHCWET